MFTADVRVQVPPRPPESIEVVRLRCFSSCQKSASQSSPPQRRIKSNPFSTGACTWAKILIRLHRSFSFSCHPLLSRPVLSKISASLPWPLRLRKGRFCLWNVCIRNQAQVQDLSAGLRAQGHLHPVKGQVGRGAFVYGMSAYGIRPRSRISPPDSGRRDTSTP